MPFRSGDAPATHIALATGLPRRLAAAARRGGRAAASAPRVWRGRRVRRQQPLDSLFVLYPRARQAFRRDAGLQTIPVAAIRGTAVEGADQRATDFRPLAGLRTADWAARWQNLVAAGERLTILPPIEVLRAAGAYWVVDGHNRVALALRNGQLAIDAAVVELELGSPLADAPGSSDTGTPAALMGPAGRTSFDADGAQLRAAGAGRLSGMASDVYRERRELQAALAAPHDRCSCQAGDTRDAARRRVRFPRGRTEEDPASRMQRRVDLL